MFFRSSSALRFVADFGVPFFTSCFGPGQYTDIDTQYFIKYFIS